MSEQPQVKRRRGTKHDRTGCLTCRARRKKCVENTLPRCGSCVRLNLECVREPLRRVVLGGSNAPREVNIDARPPQDGLVPGSANGRSPSTRVFMRYYVNFLAPKLTACGYQNSFLSALLPMAMESQTLFDSVVALASGNLSNFDPTYQVAAMEARSRALRGLGADVSRPFAAIHDYETALASCLLLSASEAILGLRTGWSEHLAGARSVIMSAHRVDSRGPEAFRGSPEGEWLLRNFAYHDILGSVTSGRPALIPGDYLEGLGDTVDSYLGVHSQLLVYISQISALRAPEDMLAADEQRSDGDETVDPMAALCQIEQKLRSWHPRSSDPILEATAYAYKSAALIYLYQRMRQTTPMTGTLDSMVSGEVQVVLENIAKIPEDAHPDGILLFPLFMAGETTDVQVMETIRSRLRSIDTIRGFRNVLRACEVLEEVWWTRTTATECNSVDWKDILHSQGGGLLLT